MRYSPVPVREGDLLQMRTVGGLRLTEARHVDPVAWHAHDQTTLTILLEGTFEESYGGVHRSRVCEPLAVLVRPAGEPHADRMGRCGALNLVVEVEALRLDLGVTQALGEYRSVELERVSLGLRRELAGSDTATPLLLEGLTLELLALLQRAADGASVAHVPPRLAAARELLHDHSGRDVTMAELAALVGVHPVYLARAFRTHYGMSPGAYLRRIRVQKAAERLRASTESIAVIAADYGFTDQSHFTRVFRAAYGVTPGQYRR